MADSPTELETKKPQSATKQVSRRSFLDFLWKGGLAVAFLGGGSAHLTKDIWQPEVVRLGIESLRNPKTIETALSQSARLLETIAKNDERAPGAPPVTKNPSYRSIAQIISEAIGNYQKKGSRPTFKRVAGYCDVNYYIDKMQDIASEGRKQGVDPYDKQLEVISQKLLGIDPGTFGRAVINTNFFPPGVKDIWDNTISWSRSAQDIPIPGSGFQQRVDEASQAGSSTEDAIRGYIEDIKKHVESLVTTNGLPTSASAILEYCLERNEGSIDMSLLDTMIFLKYMSRNDVSLDTFDNVVSNPTLAQDSEDWFRTHILDEYGQVGNYQTLPHKTFPYNGLLSKFEGFADTKVDKDLHSLNQIGKPYHAWNIALLIIAVPPSIAQMGVAWRTGAVFSEQGPVKVASDFRAALELENISSKFDQYQNV